MNFLRQSTAVDLALGPFIDDDGITPATGLSITQAECRLKKNNGAWAQINDATTATHEEEGWYEKEFDATDTNTVGILIVAVYISGNLAYWKEFQVVEEAVYDMFFAASAIGYIANQPVDVNTIKTQTVTCAGGVTVPAATLASTTNITAGTITTVTNLTNAPTAGDFTATMKTSIGTAVAASAVASVTGNVGGNVTGSVGSVVGAVGSVTGAVGSVTGNVGGNVTGSLGSLAAQAKADVNAEVDTAISDAALATAANLETVDTVVDAIKVQTDKLTFTVANQLDANIQSINDVTITGDGQVGTEFGV